MGVGVSGDGIVCQRNGSGEYAACQHGLPFRQHGLVDPARRPPRMTCWFRYGIVPVGDKDWSAAAKFWAANDFDGPVFTKYACNTVLLCQIPPFDS
jgi:hypothetical protein